MFVTEKPIDGTRCSSIEVAYGRAIVEYRVTDVHNLSIRSGYIGCEAGDNVGVFRIVLPWNEGLRESQSRPELAQPPNGWAPGFKVPKTDELIKEIYN